MQRYMNTIYPNTLRENMTQAQLYKLVIIIGAIIFCILGVILYYYMTPGIQKKSFFKDVELTNSEYVIPKNKLNMKNGGKEYSISMWLRINNWYNQTTSQYGSSKERNIFSYGSKDTGSTKGTQQTSTHENVVPSVWLDNKKNDLNIYIQTLQGSQAVKVKNIPLQKWFKLTVVMTKNSIQVFLNSKLDVFKFLKGDIIIPNGDLYLFTHSPKIDGQFSNVIFYKQALTTAEVAKLYAVGDKPIGKSLLYRFVNFFTKIGRYRTDSKLKKNIA